MTILRGGPRLSRKLRTVLTAAVAAAAGLTMTLLALPANALNVTETPKTVTGNGTWFDGLGDPYGGCGLPKGDLETPYYIALNVYNTPKNYDFYTRPMPEGDAKIGMWNNGHNCGRWVEVTVNDFCDGINDGMANAAFCRKTSNQAGEYVADKYNGAKLKMLVADSCGDANAWCRDDPYHIDLSKASINNFELNGSKTTDLLDHWNNRLLDWKFIEAPNYTGDIQIGMLQSAQLYWPAIAVSRLPNGVHSVEYYNGGSWKTAKMNGDMGQSFIIDGLTTGADDFKIRVKDASDKYVGNGRVYHFSMPASCKGSCSQAYTKTTYTTEGGTDPSTGPTGPEPSSAAPSSVAPSSAAPSSVAPSSVAPSSAVPSSNRPSNGCTATFKASNTWSSGFQGEVTVTAGSTAIKGWTVSWALASGQSLAQTWNATATTSGSTVSFKNAAYNGALAAKASTTFGFVGNGSSATAPVLSCAAS